MININELNKLEDEKRESPNNVFTMYLNTDPSDPDQQGGKWKINLKNGLQKFEHYLKQDNNDEEIKNFKVIKEKVQDFISQNELNLQRGIFIVATADESIWVAEIVQVRLKSEFFLEERPALYQIQSLIKEFPKSGIILVRKNIIKIIESVMNEVTDTTYFELNLETENWHRKTGELAGGPGAAKILTDNFDARYEANQQRWYKSIAPKLDKHAKDQEWEQIIIVGEGEATQIVKDHMNKPIDHIINKNMLEHSDSKVMKEVFG